MFTLFIQVVFLAITLFTLVPVTLTLETLCRSCVNQGVTFTFDSPKGHFKAHVDSCACESKQKARSQDNSVVFEDLDGSSFVMNTRNWARKCEQWSEGTPCCIFE